ncbi:uncharacterized protein LOC131671301 [Phymastichus coffea]|uniref:uncharacterized protein LOC131671301 n=1 Tax=Phymastichus coffea TaxID=108790 RepID=UPI00273BF622|nr:uncharacterized protein LOC131671301 [Phymastichus coffea]
MYLPIKVREKDRADQHLLYRGADCHREPDEYQMTCFIFGSKSSLCSALYVKNKNVEQYATVKPEAAKSLVRNYYMDDYLTSGKSVAAMRKLVNDVIFINKEANFEMHGLASNVPEIVRDVRKENLLCKNEKASLCEEEDRVLGLFWDRENDCLRFHVGIKKLRDDLLTGATEPTKREFCSIVMSVYDPLGILSPFSINAKIMLQHIWRSGVAWDAKIRDEKFQTWKAWLQNGLEMTKCEISRCFIPMGVDYARTELHVFCDASLQAYAAVAYLRTTSPDGKVYLSLVMAKTRVAPVKSTTIPRLELQAAVLGTRLAANISKELDIKINNVVFWSDSSTVLQWIHVGPHLKLTYVKNRLGEIAEITQVSQWRWDRGPPSSWPEERKLKADELVQINELETRKDFIGTSIANIVSTPLTVKLLGWRGLLVVATRVRNCVNKWSRCRSKNKSEQPSLRPQSQATLAEVRPEAMRFWYREIQRACFAEEIDALNRQKEFRKGSKLINLRPFIDKNGILRAESRVQGAELSYNPIILDARHFATKLLIDSYHKRFFHANNETIVNELRQEFFIVGLRRRLRTLARDCLTCKLRRAQPQNPPMANLPKCRVAYNLRPFTHCGIDYFGPMIVKIGRRCEKRWGVLFTCMTIRAIYLEIANSLTASSAIMSIQRFANRRKFPRMMYSDNGTNFTKASKELKDAVSGIDTERQRRFAEEKGFEWRFNPPDATYMGRAWERRIRSVKVALDHALKGEVPTEEVLSTLLVEIEHMVNSRPLTHVSVNPNNEEALTPNHFLIGSSPGHLRLERYEAEIKAPTFAFTFEVPLFNVTCKSIKTRSKPALVKPTVTHLPLHKEI